MVAYGAVSTDLFLSGLPAIIQEFSASHAQGQLTLSIFMVGYAIGQLMFGTLSDAYGRLRLLYWGLGFYVIASVACIFATSLEMLLAGRLAQGMAAASGPVIARVLVREYYEPKESMRVMSVLAGAMALAPALAPILGSWMLYWFDWRSHFVLLMLFALFSLMGVYWVLSEPKRHSDTAGHSLTSLPKQFLVCLKHPLFCGYVLTGSLCFAGMFAFISSTSFLVIEVMGVAAENFGYCFMVVVLGYMTGSFTCARLYSRLSRAKIMRVGALLNIVAVLSLLLMHTGDTTSLLLLLPFAGYFFGAALIIPGAQMGSLAVFERGVGSASSIYGFVQVMSGALVGMLVGQLYDGTVLPVALVMLVASVLVLLVLMVITPYFSQTGSVIPHGQSSIED